MGLSSPEHRLLISSLLVGWPKSFVGSTTVIANDKENR